MLHSFSFGELALIFGIIIVLFGGSRLASIGKALGEGISNFKKGLNTTIADEKPKTAESEAVSGATSAAPPQVPSSLSFGGANSNIVDVESTKESSHSRHL